MLKIMRILPLPPPCSTGIHKQLLKRWKITRILPCLLPGGTGTYCIEVEDYTDASFASTHGGTGIHKHTLRSWHWQHITRNWCSQTEEQPYLDSCNCKFQIFLNLSIFWFSELFIKILAIRSQNVQKLIKLPFLTHPCHLECPTMGSVWTLFSYYSPFLCLQFWNKSTVLQCTRT